ETRIIPGPVGILQKALARKKADVQAGGHHNILKTQEYVRKVNKDVSEDDHFMQGPWLQAIVYLHGEGLTVSGCLDDMKKICQEGKLELVVGVVKSCTPNSLGDMIVTLKDPTGTMGGTIHYKVFQDEKIDRVGVALRGTPRLLEIRIDRSVGPLTPVSLVTPITSTPVVVARVVVVAAVVVITASPV
nr:hypothetical protein [Tanacetum cinerariifolium]